MVDVTRILLILITASSGLAREEPTHQGLSRLLAEGDFEEAIEYALEARDEGMRGALLEIVIGAATSRSHLVALIDNIDELRADRGRVHLLQRVLSHPAADTAVRLEVLDELDELDRDGPRAAVLRRLIRFDDAGLVPALVDELDEIRIEPARFALMRELIERYPAAPLLEADLLDEIEDLDAPPMRLDLMISLLEKRDVTSREREILIENARDVLDDQQRLKTFLIAAGRRSPADEILVRAAASLDSDSYKYEVLMPVIESAVAAETLTAVLECTEEMDSDSYRVEILSRAAEVAPGAVTAQILRVAEDIESESGNMQVAIKLIESEPGREQLTMVLEKLPDLLRSDHNLRMLLTKSMEMAEPDERFFRMISRMDSEHERATVLIHVLDTHELSEEQLASAIRTSLDLSSEHERFRVILRLVRGHEITPSLEIVFEEALQSFGKRHFRKEIERALHQ